jgi:hypothetical protein
MLVPKLITRSPAQGPGTGVATDESLRNVVEWLGLHRTPEAAIFMRRIERHIGSPDPFDLIAATVQARMAIDRFTES